MENFYLLDKRFQVTPGISRSGFVHVSELLTFFLFLRHSALLGTQLADLHLHNQQLREKMKKEGSTVGTVHSCLKFNPVNNNLQNS